MVVPSVPEMVDDVLEDLKSGSIQKFNLAMDKLDKLVNKLGIDLKQYNKELANFAARREEKIIKSEEKIQTLKEKNVIAEITKAGDIKEKYCCTACTKMAEKYNYTNNIFTFVNGCKCSAVVDDPPLSRCYEIN